MPRKRITRIYTRSRGGAVRYYGDFRDYADVGGGREPLVPRGGRVATSDRDVAQDIAAQRVRQLDALRRKKQITGVGKESGLAAFAALHLDMKAEAGKVETSSIEMMELHLRSAVAFFGQDRELDAIGVDDVQSWARHLARQPNRKGGKLSATSVRKYLNSLSNLYRRAGAEGYVTPGFNPVAGMVDKPSGVTREEAEWLEVDEMALFLEAAAHYSPARDHMQPIPPAQAYALIATFALTGGREAEVLGLAADDVSLDRRAITFRPNQWRRLKTRTSWRTIPLWPQLEEVLRAYLFGGGAPAGPLLFPSPRLGAEHMLTDVRSMLDAVASLCGWKAGEIRTKMFRHTYTAARLQTADRVLVPGRRSDDPESFQWVPVSEFTVGKELGHGGHSLVRRVYGHLGNVTHRSDVVEFRAAQHADRIREPLAALRANTLRPRQCRGSSMHTGKPCEATGGLSADGLCVWHDPARRDRARASRPHAIPHGITDAFDTTIDTTDDPAAQDAKTPPR
jgi:integrase